MTPTEFRDLRVAKKYTQAALAEAMGISKRTVERCEHHRVQAPLGWLLSALPRCKKKCNPRVI